MGRLMTRVPPRCRTRAGTFLTLLISLVLLGCTACGAEPARSSGGIEVVVTKKQLGEGRPRGLYVDDTHIYWSQAIQGIRRIAKGGGGVETLGPFNDLALTPVVTDESYIYWLDGDHINKRSRTDGSTQRLYVGGDYYVDVSLVLDEAYVYFAAYSCLQVGRIRKDGTEIEKWTTDAVYQGGATTLLVDNESVFCADGDRIYRISKRDGMSRVLFQRDFEGIGGTALVGDRIYWLKDADSGNRLRTLMYVHKDGSGPIAVADVGKGAASELHYDDARQSLYWIGTSLSADVDRYELTANELDHVATNRRSQIGLDGDETYLYWTETDQIVRMRKDPL